MFVHIPQECFNHSSFDLLLFFSFESLDNFLRDEFMDQSLHCVAHYMLGVLIANLLVFERQLSCFHQTLETFDKQF